jgi:hypothetical protein
MITLMVARVHVALALRLKFKKRVIYSLATKGRRMLSFTLSGEWCSVLPLVFAQALVP